MSLHVPAHPAGVVNHHLLRNALLVISAVGLAVVLFAAALLVKPGTTTPTGTYSETQSLVEYRAGERADWGNPVVSERQSIIDFRAAERAR